MTGDQPEKKKKKKRKKPVEFTQVLTEKNRTQNKAG